MSAANGTIAIGANSGAAKDCSRECRALHLNSALMQKARELFPNKTAHHLADITSYSLRTCGYWLSGEAKIPSDALAMILRSEWGLEFLTVLMEESPAPWWRKLAAYFAAITARSLQRAAQRKMQEAIDADVEFSVQSEALLIQDEAFYRPHFEAARAGAVTPRRVAAPAAKRKR